MDFKRNVIRIRGGRFRLSRNIPIGPDLLARLQRYKRGRAGARSENLHFFVGRDGKALNGLSLRVAFRRLRRLAGIERYDGAEYQPRMEDFRATFAVHLLASWLRQKADTNRPIPALSAYMWLCTRNVRR